MSYHVTNIVTILVAIPACQSAMIDRHILNILLQVFTVQNQKLSQTQDRKNTHEQHEKGAALKHTKRNRP